MTTTDPVMLRQMSRHLNAFNPYMRMLRGVEPVTEETTRLMQCRVTGDDEIAFKNRAEVQAFIDKENA